MEKAIKEMMDMKATRDDKVPGDVLTLLREDDLILMKQLINNIYETVRVAEDFNHIKIITLKKKLKLQHAAITAQSALLHMQET